MAEIPHAQHTSASHHENRLAKEKSPYLLQHKNNPVDWCDAKFKIGNLALLYRGKSMAWRYFILFKGIRGEKKRLRRPERRTSQSFCRSVTARVSTPSLLSSFAQTFLDRNVFVPVAQPYGMPYLIHQVRKLTFCCRCSWCHVMERESFESEETAKVMNAKFVNIKVDREERPDIDKVYMVRWLLQ
jgi:hypothetical protein